MDILKWVKRPNGPMNSAAAYIAFPNALLSVAVATLALVLSSARLKINFLVQAGCPHSALPVVSAA